MSSNYVPPNAQRTLRACMVCSIIQTQHKFLREGCPNCESILSLYNQPDQIAECTSQVFEGSITLADPKKSWVARWQRLDRYVPGVYAVKVTGILPEDVIEALHNAGMEYVPFDVSPELQSPKEHQTALHAQNALTRAFRQLVGAVRASRIARAGGAYTTSLENADPVPSLRSSACTTSPAERRISTRSAKSPLRATVRSPAMATTRNMRVATVQFCPEPGAVSKNIATVDALLSQHSPSLEEISLLILPEMAFTSYVFSDYPAHLYPLLEPTAAGPSSVWAQATARQLGCHVQVGYPELEKETGKRFNSAILVDPSGAMVGHYRKHHLYMVDEEWAEPGPAFESFDMSVSSLPSSNDQDTEQKRHDEKVKVTTGICMDLNPLQFKAPWGNYEFARHVQKVSASLVLVSMAWNAPPDVADQPELYEGEEAKRFDEQTIRYWISRLQPLWDPELGAVEKEKIVICSNRSGFELGTRYIGSSCILGIAKDKVKLYGALGRGETGVLVVDVSV